MCYGVLAQSKSSALLWNVGPTVFTTSDAVGIILSSGYSNQVGSRFDWTVLTNIRYASSPGADAFYDSLSYFGKGNSPSVPDYNPGFTSQGAVNLISHTEKLFQIDLLGGLNYQLVGNDRHGLVIGANIGLTYIDMTLDAQVTSGILDSQRFGMIKVSVWHPYLVRFIDFSYNLNVGYRFKVGERIGFEAKFGRLATILSDNWNWDFTGGLRIDL